VKSCVTLSVITSLKREQELDYTRSITVPVVRIVSAALSCVLPACQQGPVRNPRVSTIAITPRCTTGSDDLRNRLIPIGYLGRIGSHEPQHLLLQLRIHLVRDRYNLGKQCAEI